MKDMIKEIRYKPIGIIHSPFKETNGMPIQPIGAKGILGSVEIFPEFCEGLKDIEGFSHIILVYHFHRSKGYSLLVKPFVDDKKRGVFATRAPRRPNPIGISVVRLVKVERCNLQVEGIDVLDGTPLLDIKPYVPEFDFEDRVKVRTGWLEGKIHLVKKKRLDRQA